MSDNDRMTIDERRKYLRRMKKRYKGATKKVRGQLLDDMGAVTGLHRKSLIRLLNGPLARKHRLEQQGRAYGPDVDDALKIMAESLDHPCAERLTPVLGKMGVHLFATMGMPARDFGPRTWLRQRRCRIRLSIG